MDPLSKLSPQLALLWRAMHDRLSSGRPVSPVRVGPLDSRQHAALADLLGLGRTPGEYPAISLTALDQILTESVGAGTREVVTQLIGPWPRASSPPAMTWRAISCRCALRAATRLLTLSQLRAGGDMRGLPTEAWVFENPLDVTNAGQAAAAI